MAIRVQSKLRAALSRCYRLLGRPGGRKPTTSKTERPDDACAVAVREFIGTHRPAGNGKRVLIWRGTSAGSMVTELIVANAMILRGFDVKIVICDGVQSACIRRCHTLDTPVEQWPEACGSCESQGRGFCQDFDVEPVPLSELVPESVRDELRAKSFTVDVGAICDIEHRGVLAGHFLDGGIKRYLKGAPFEAGTMESIAREYLYGFLVSAEAAHMALDAFSPDYIFTTHCMYTDWGPIFAAAKLANVPVTTFTRSYKKVHFFLGRVAHGDNKNIKTVPPDLWAKISASDFTPRHEALLGEYLEARYKGAIATDMADFPEYQRLVKSEFVSRFDLDPEKPTWCMFTHTNWDDLSNFETLLYDFNEWAIETIRLVWDTPDINFLIKIHPYEAETNQKYGTAWYIDQAFSDLPSHIKVIPADVEINPMAFLDIVDGGITMSGTVGVELSLMGKPVVVAGKGHYSGLGFTHDAYTLESYASIIKGLRSVGRLTDEQVLLAKKFAYTLFIRRQIPIPLGQTEDFGPIDPSLLENLLPGHDAAMDMICDEIVSGGEFILDDPALSEG